ncbi:hypothetical protein FA95DRAFT_1297164 [Auriscalpium vulgare]|uniref:Uncharacterized protein n=1 Tax=Auriscalpium vulgare TaxID=40419 RepID=A0ACB8RS68_9AGAM|nr:hypothetical protein FA95DRAFT_1297164 [Auriscalpium vulgare]
MGPTPMYPRAKRLSQGLPGCPFAFVTRTSRPFKVAWPSLRPFHACQGSWHAARLPRARGEDGRMRMVGSRGTVFRACRGTTGAPRCLWFAPTRACLLGVDNFWKPRMLRACLLFFSHAAYIASMMVDIIINIVGLPVPMPDP